MTRFCSIFSQLLQLFPRTEFQQIVVATQAERPARGFGCWDQFVAMLFCQLGRANSLREICGGLASCEGRLAHLGVTAPPKSTLAYANAHRPWQLYEQVFYHLLDRCRGVTTGKKFRFKNRLLSLRLRGSECAGAQVSCCTDDNCFWPDDPPAPRSSTRPERPTTSYQRSLSISDGPDGGLDKYAVAVGPDHKNGGDHAIRGHSRRSVAADHFDILIAAATRGLANAASRPGRPSQQSSLSQGEG